VNRVQALQAELERNGQRGAIITSMETIRYLTGHYVWTSHSPTTFMVVPATGSAALFVPKGDDTLARLMSRIGVDPYDPGARPYATAATLSHERLTKNGGGAGRVAIESGAITVDRFEPLREAFSEWTVDDLTPSLNRLRMVKDDDEQQAFRRAAYLMGHAMGKTIGALKPGASELEIKGVFDHALYAESSRRWPEAMAVAQTNVLSGDRLSRLHDGAHGRAIGAGETVWVLSHAHWNGYWANISRNVFAPGGSPDPAVLRAQEAVVDAQRSAIARLLPGEPLRQAWTAAHDALARHNLLEKKVYGIFRGLGLRYDEPPKDADLDTILKAGMCLTVAVHVRLPSLIVGQGDSVLITGRGPEVVSQAEA
jgi:Xaa-Pro aminopeptidase